MDQRDARAGAAATLVAPLARAHRAAAIAVSVLAVAVVGGTVAGCAAVRQIAMPADPTPGAPGAVGAPGERRDGGGTDDARPTDEVRGADELRAADVAATSAVTALLQPTDAATSSAVATATRARGTPFDPDETHVSLEAIATGLDEPVHATGDGVDAQRLYVVEKAGTIEIVDLASGTVADAPFVDLSDRVNSRASEQGLLSVAFHPDYAANGRLFVNYTRRDGATVVSELAADADRRRADPASEREILVVDQPAANHNGGQNAFGPDGYLYVGMGDGGGSGAGKNAHDPSSLLGKVLRLDVDGPPGGYRVPADNPFIAGDHLPEVWAVGLRNPWRLSFDRATGDLFIADVGDSTYEEVNWQPAASRGGEDYGWPDVEGAHCHDADDGAGDSLAACDPDGRTTRPVAEYRHEDGNCSISGGHVYRGRRYPALDGVYFYADYCSGRLWGAWRDDRGRWHDAMLTDSDAAISAFGQDDAGEVYALDMAGGAVLRVAAGGR